MDLEIVIAPDERLHAQCEPVEHIDNEIKALVAEMARAMYTYEGCGIAAPQVGVLKQIIVIDCDWADSGKKNPVCLINPVIIEKSEETAAGFEGCLSIPGISCEIERATSICVQALDIKGRLMQYKAANNLFCVCLQHEIDHLHGYTMFERLEPAARVNALLQYQEALAAGAKPGQTE